MEYMKDCLKMFPVFTKKEVIGSSHEWEHDFVNQNA